MDEEELIARETLAYYLTLVTVAASPGISQEETFEILFEFLFADEMTEQLARECGEKIRATAALYQGDTRH